MAPVISRMLLGTLLHHGHFQAPLDGLTDIYFRQVKGEGVFDVESVRILTGLYNMATQVV